MPVFVRPLGGAVADRDTFDITGLSTVGDFIVHLKAHYGLDHRIRLMAGKRNLTADVPMSELEGCNLSVYGCTSALKQAERRLQKGITKASRAHTELAVAHHEESMEQFGGLHAKLDEMAGAGTAFLSALDTGELPPRPADQSDEQRLRLLRCLKRAADNEIPQLQENENIHAQDRPPCGGSARRRGGGCQCCGIASGHRGSRH